ncbi:MAG: hypothetical protein HC887_04635 [Desulfobacteraceae bacterium]|nr:hypothetical protein [Desulfobacteraceae bacterium]
MQYICQSLVSHINLKIQRNYAEASDLDDVVEFIVRNPAGHIQETWRALPDQAKMTLTALAHTIRDTDAYTKPEKVIGTARNSDFRWEKGNITKQFCYQR